MSTYAERIKYLRTEVFNCSQGAFAKKLNLNQVNISDIERGRKVQIDFDFAMQLRNEYNVNLDWLATGEGSPLLEDLYDKELFYRQKYKDILTIGLLEQFDFLNDEDINYNFDCKLYDIPEHTTKIFKVQGDAMDSGANQIDDIRDGDFILIDTNKTYIDGGVYLFLDKNNFKIRKLRQIDNDTILMTPFNRIYSEDKITLNNKPSEIKILGKVLYNVTSRPIK